LNVCNASLYRLLLSRIGVRTPAGIDSLSFFAASIVACGPSSHLSDEY